MKKGIKLVALLLGLALVAPACTPGSNPGSTSGNTQSSAAAQYTVTISNKEELQAEWFVGDQSRKVNIEVEPKANVAQLVNEGLITITSSDPEKLAITGQMASPVAAGEVTITVKCGESQDTVALTLKAKQTVQEKYGVEHAGTEEDPFTNEEACKVAKAENYNNEDFYVKGTVASFYHAPGSRTDGAVSWYLEPATAGGEKFEIYKCYKSTGSGAESYLTDADVWVGGVTTAHGTFTTYGDQAETTGAKLVKCEGEPPAPRQTLEKTFAEVLAVGNALPDGGSAWDYYKFQAFVTVMDGDNFFLTATKGEELIPGKSDADHQQKDIKGTNAIELYNAGKNADLKAKLTKNAKIEVTMIVKNYHGTIENGLDLTKDDVTVLQEGEPWVINYQEKTTAEALAIINALEDGATAEGYYAVSGVVVAVTSAYNAQYGNMDFTIADKADDANVLKVFRYATDAETAAKIVAGLQVVVKGQLQKYKDKNNNIVPELINAKEVVFDDQGQGGGGGEQVETRVIDFSLKTANHNAYNDTWTYGDATIAGGANNNGAWAFVKMGGKSATISAEGHPGTWIKTNDAVAYQVASVTIKYVGKCYNQDSEKATVKVESYSDAALATKVAETPAAEVAAIDTNEGINEVTYEFAAPQAANLFYKINFDIINTTNYNGVVALEKVTFNAPAAPAAPVKEWSAADIKTALSASTTEVSGKYAADSDETFTAYKISTANMTITLNVNVAEAQHVKLQLKMATKFSNISKCGIWWQLPNGKSGLDNVVQKTEVSLGTNPLPVPEEKSLDYTNLASYNPVQSPDAKDSGSPLSAPVWVDMLELDLAAGDNAITVKYLDGGYSYWVAGAQLIK